LAAIGEKIEEGDGAGAKVADREASRQRGGMRQDTAGS
jgi:hypothetical protein